jgi:ribosome-associated translation inhibitor RaiA
VAEATVWLKGHTLRARESSPDMKASIDELTDKLLRQIKDARDKKAARRKSVDKHALLEGAAEAAASESAPAEAAE